MLNPLHERITMNDLTIPAITLPADATLLTHVVYRLRGAEGLLRAWLRCRALLDLNARITPENLARFATYPGLPSVPALMWTLFLSQPYCGIRPLDLVDAERLSVIHALRAWQAAQG
jgi:hypothetical protein